MDTWRPGSDDVRRVFAEQNPWQTGGSAVPTILAPPVERPLARHLWNRLVHDNPRRFHLVLGPRRVGKTTAMYQTVRHLIAAGLDPGRLWWLRLDHPVLLASPLDELVRMVIELSGATVEDPVVLFLDEVVYAREWDLWLKTFYDDRWPVRIVATASATAALRHRRVESGVGRWEEHYLPPYSFTEYLDLAGASPSSFETQSSLAASLGGVRLSGAELSSLAASRRHLLLVGGFPELLVDHLTPDGEDNRLLGSQQVLRSDAVERAIYKDIPQSFGVDNPMALERLLYVLAGQVGGILSPTNICQELGLSQPTFDRYLSYLERAFLIVTAASYSGREVNVQKRGRKLYFVDGAVRNAALQRGLAPLTNPVEMGLLVENLVASNLHAFAQQTGSRLFFWRDGRHEVDLVMDAPHEPLAIEVALSVDHSRAGLIALRERHPRFAESSWLVAPDAPFVAPSATSSGVGTMPVDALLLAVGAHAAAAAQARLGGQLS